MDIGRVNNKLPDRGPESLRSQNQQPESKPASVDKIEISLQARRKLAELADSAMAAEKKSERTGLDKTAQPNEAAKAAPGKAESLEEVRRRIESGFYDQPEVKRTIAENLSDELDV